MSEAQPATGPKCVICAGPINAGALRCNTCDSFQDYKRCVSCYHPIPFRAYRCNACGTPQTLRRFFHVPETTLSLLTAMVAVCTLALTQISNLVNIRSHTSISFVSADSNYLYADILNSGRSKSIVRSAELHFTGLPIGDVPLRIVIDEKVSAKKIVPAEGEIRLKLLVPGLERRNATDTRLKKAEILKKVAASEVMLEIKVEESNGRIKKPADRFPGFEIERLVDHKLSRTVS